MNGGGECLLRENWRFGPLTDQSLLHRVPEKVKKRLNRVPEKVKTA